MSLYEDLGLSKGADSQEIRRAYLKLSKTEHPDKGGDEERFKKLQTAYEILSDDEKRTFYDQTGQIPGQEMQQPQSHGVPFPFDIPGMFGGMFGGFGGFGGMGGGGPRRHQQKHAKAPPKIQEIGLTLHDYFFGKKIQLQFGRQKFCDQCKGEGAESFDHCGICSGSGIRQQVIMIGPGMQAMSQGPCGPCRGEGKTPKGQCGKCNGSKFISQEKILHISIEPGMKPGDVMKFPGECSDQHEYEEAGDVHIVMRDAEEKSTMIRKADDLTTTVAVTLQELLLGTQKIVHGHPAHPVGLTVDIPPGVMRGDIVMIKGEGMPRSGTALRGNLLITIAIELKDAEKDILKRNHAAIKALFTPS